MTPAKFFIAAAIVLLLGASAVPIGISEYSIAQTSHDPYAMAMGVWAVVVVIVGVAGPIVLTVAGIIALATRHEIPSESPTDQKIADAVAWLSDEPQISRRR